MVQDVLHIKPTRLSKAATFLQGYGPKYPNGKYMTVTQDSTGKGSPHNLQSSAAKDVNVNQNKAFESRAARITEIFEPTTHIPSHRVGSGSYIKKIGGDDYMFLVKRVGPGHIGVSFSKENKLGFSQAQSTADNPRVVMEVFQTMSSMLFAYLDKNPDTRLIEFSAADMSASRAKLYTRMAHRLAQRLGGRAEITPGYQSAKIRIHL